MNEAKIIRRKILQCYYNMIRRCYNTKCKCYKSYGAQGIDVCKEWKTDKESFVNWSIDNGYSIGLTIDRRDGWTGYTPKNCRWIPKTVNSSRKKRKCVKKNKYNTNNRIINNKNVDRNIKDYFLKIKMKPSPWAIKHKIGPWTISRLLSGKTISPGNALKICKASGGKITLKDIFGA